MKKTLIVIIGLLASYLGYANHLKGGWIYYENQGAGSQPNTIKYLITVKQYLDCNSTSAQIDKEVYLGIFTNSDNQLFSKRTIPKSGTDFLEKETFSPCISPTPTVCYRIDSYQLAVELPITPFGYTLAVQRCCRIKGIINVTASDQIGVTYTTTIPGTSLLATAPNNNSPVFAQKDTAVVCFKGDFTFDFSASDDDGDSLVYSFCSGLVGGSAGNTQNAAQPNPPSNPPYGSVPYSGSYSGTQPLGPTVSINPKTGLISGTAPATTGDYVVAVCATEFRNGVKIGDTKKEIHITVANCSLSAADLKPSYITCDGFDLTFQNESTSQLVSTYTWEFGDPRSGSRNISSSPTATHTYTDTGVFVLKLKVESSGGCKDSTTSLVRVFPGFVADFDINGSCFETPFNFTDKTFSKYGVVNSWRWDFGNVNANDNISNLKNPSYKYPSSGKRTVQLITTNSKGCMDTVSKEVQVLDIPFLRLPFHDTLICSIDTLPLKAEGSGVFSWTPRSTMINSNSANPLVFPKDTTTYVVTLNENGCVNKDSITVNVLDFISVDVAKDTSICRTDSMTIQTTSHALQYSWSPASGLNDPAAKNPHASPAVTTRYYVTANLGKCQDKDSILIKVAPYPLANAGSDVSICYGAKTQLTGAITGSSFKWTPTNGLANASTLNPIAAPSSTTRYVLAAYDTVGCPKPFKDTVTVTVIPKVIAFAGNDTMITANQPLQLNATGGFSYTWSPAFGLSNPNIPDPIATLGPSIDLLTYKVRVGTPEGCFAEDDIKVTVFKTGPDIFIPTGFTPNGDRKNDVLKPILVGMKTLTYFNVYNRWGQLIFSTAEAGRGWNGTFAGKDQQSGTYIFTAEGLDYNGHRITKKGTVVLIR